MSNFTPHQQNIIRRYYDNREGIALQRLGEITTDLYLAESDKKRKQLWKRAANELATIGRHESWCERVIQSEDAERLAELLTELMSGVPKGKS
jgi:hypothetical protein